MRRSVVALLALIPIGGTVWACAASSGFGLSAARYSAQDLASADYETVYDLLEAHTRVRLAASASDVPIRIRYPQGGGISMSGADNPSENPSVSRDTVSSRGGGSGLCCGKEQASDFTGRTGTKLYVPAQLYIDDQEVGAPLPRLRDLSLDRIESLVLLRPDEASSRYGGSGDVGIVHITLKEQEK